MRNIKLHIIILLMASVLSACSYRPKVGAPWAQKMFNDGPPGPINFRKGWRDGCETGISVTSNAFQRHFYKFTQDSSLALDPVYYTGWKSAYDYCQRATFQYLRRSIL